MTDIDTSTRVRYIVCGPPAEIERFRRERGLSQSEVVAVSTGADAPRRLSGLSGRFQLVTCKSWRPAPGVWADVERSLWTIVVKGGEVDGFSPPTGRKARA